MFEQWLKNIFGSKPKSNAQSEQPTANIEKIRQMLGEENFSKFWKAFNEESSKPPQIAVIGQSGVGKSTTINALFNLNEKVSHTTTGTTEASEKVVNLPQGGKLSIIDLPGLGEDIELDKKYKDIYQKFLPSADVVLYVFQADLRVLKTDQEILKEIIENILGDLKDRLVIGLNQVDKISPGTWNVNLNRPSPEQEDNIKRRCEDIQQKLSESLSIKVEQIEYYSALKRYRLYNLLTSLIKATTDKGWKFPLNPADPLDLVDEQYREVIRKQLNS